MLQLTGSLFWGCLFSGVNVAIIAALVSFVLVSEHTVFLVQRIVAILAAILTITVIKKSIMFFGGKVSQGQIEIVCSPTLMSSRTLMNFKISLFQNFFVGLYRKRPAAANIYFLALECKYPSPVSPWNVYLDHAEAHCENCVFVFNQGANFVSTLVSQA